MKDNKSKTAAWAVSKPENLLSIIIHNNPQAVIDYLHENYEDIPDEMDTKTIFNTCKTIANSTGDPGAWVHNLKSVIAYSPSGEPWTLIHNKN